MTLDILQSDDPKIVQLMHERRHASDLQKIAMEEYDLRTKELQLKKSICSLCDLASARMEENMTESKLRGYHNRIKAFEETFEQTRELLGHLGALLSSFGNFQKEREQIAAEKLSKAKDALHEHMRLYGDDEAPTERKDLQGRVTEFTEVVRRSRQTLAAVVLEQVELWSSDELPTEVTNLAKMKLGPVIRSLPFSEEFAHRASFFDVTVQKHQAAVVNPEDQSSAERIIELKTLGEVKRSNNQWGYDSDDFLETDETSSASSSNPGHVVPSISSAQYEALKTAQAISSVSARVIEQEKEQQQQNG
jgi:hypothetical protein